MRVVIINKSDSVGGAAVVSLRLMRALCDAGVDARMLVVDHRVTDDSRVGSYASAVADKATFLAERMQIFMNNGFSRANLFTVDTARFGRDISTHEWVTGADVIMLNWINQGALSLKAVGRICALGKPVIWTMHDMWNCTGICHHAGECTAYTDRCGRCRLLKSHRTLDIARLTQIKKSRLYSNHPNLTFVAVSNWLGFRCRESSLMENALMEIIPNAFPVDNFAYSRIVDNHYPSTVGKKVIVMGAARLDDPIKGLDLLIEACRHIAATKPHLAERLHLLLYGSIRDRSLLDKIAIGHTFVGQIDGLHNLNEIYRHADVVVSASRYETLPGTLIEGQASGCVPVTFGKGGQADIVDHRRTGYIARYIDIVDLADGIEWATECGIDRQALHHEVRTKFSAEAVAQSYIELCRRLLRKQGIMPQPD